MRRRNDFCILVRDQRPGEANEARISVGIPNEFSPHHYQDESGHNTSRGHGCWLGLGSSFGVKLCGGAGAELGHGRPFSVTPIHRRSIPEAELILTELIVI